MSLDELATLAETVADADLADLVAETRALRAVLRDVMVDWVPPCDREDGVCECSANRARRYLRASGAEL